MAAIPPLTVSRDELEDLYQDYADLLDEDRLEEWLELFTDDCLYKIMPLENHRRGLPLGTMLCESRGMLADRVFAIRETAMYRPRVLRHLLGRVRVRDSTEAWLRTEVSYVVFETLADDETRLLSTGRYHDVVAPDGGRLRFREKLCVYDASLVPTSLVYPL